MYRFVLNLSTAEGASLGWFPVRVDWEPAFEEARFRGLRRGEAEPAAGSPTVEPLWHPRAGRPYVEGFRVGFAGENGGRACEFTVDYFVDAVESLTHQLWSHGQADPPSSVLYSVVALPREEVLDPERPGIGSAFPVAGASSSPALRATRHREMLEGCPILGTVHPEDYAVVLCQAVLDEAARLTGEAGSLETGGLLVGHLHRDPDHGDILAEVTAQVPAEHARSELTSLTFTRDTWAAVRQVLGERGQGESMLGWWHSHSFLKETCTRGREGEAAPCSCASGALFLSALDCALQRTVFPRAYSLALVVSDAPCCGLELGLFGWRGGRMARRGFAVRPEPHGPPILESGGAQDA